MKGSVSTARLYATCDNRMTVYLDGEKLASHDDFSMPIFREVTKAFDPPAAEGRKHVIAVEAENVGEDNPAGLLVRLDLDSGWRAAWSEISDGSWKATAAAREGWQNVEFDSASWKPAVVVAQLGGEPRPQITAATLAAAANCFGCHRFDNQGGALGPDLTSLAGRFSPRDILESVVDPNKVISDQYAAVTITTADGRVFTGRIVNLAGDSLRLNTNMLDPNAEVAIDRRQIDEMFPSKTSMMPMGLLNTLNESEVLDLMAYLLSRGDRRSAMFQQ